MKILYIGDRRDGGILRHVKCLRACLPPEVATFEIGSGGSEEFAGRNGHDIREFRQIRRVMRRFKPDIVHFHIPNLGMALYVRIFSAVPCVCSWHTPTTRKPRLGERLFISLLGRRAYFLPVSRKTWCGLRRWAPQVGGEVFFNPLRTQSFQKPAVRDGWRGNRPCVGMVGRNADQKDWPAFHRVERLVREEQPEVAFVNAGEEEPCDGREAIRRMDLFVMTSKHEELPTTMLECFLLGTPICGFLPEGGTSDILDFSDGALRAVFLAERDCDKLADLVRCLLNDPGRRQALVEDGWRILTNHFSAEKLVSGQLMNVYRGLMK